MPHPRCLVVITGVNTAGKTTLCEHLISNSSLLDYSIRQIDENGVPPVGRSGWRLFRVEQLLFEAAKNYKENSSTIIAGIVKPHEVYESQYLPARIPVHFILLDLPDAMIRHRLDDRIASIDHQNRLETGAFDESFSKKSRQGTIHHNLEYARQLRRSVSALRNGHIVHVGALTPEEMATSIVDLISSGFGRW